MTPAKIVDAVGIAHVRLTVTDIERSKSFYAQLLGQQPVADFSDQVAEPGVRDNPEKLYGGCVFQLGDQILGLRPVADAGDRFRSTRVGLDHVSLRVTSAAELGAAIQRLDAAGVSHGELTQLGEFGMAIVSVQDPDNINLELCAVTD